MDEQILTQPAPEERHEEHHHHKKAQAEARGRTVRVIATDGVQKPVDFRLESNLIDPDNGDLTFNKDKDGMGKSDYYLVEFLLQDESTKNLRFEPNPMKALWVSMGDAMNPPPCPTSASYCQDIYAVSVDQNNGKSMVVRNNDAKVQYFTFSLGFVGDPNESEYRFDPGGQNQNGGVARD